MIKKFIFFALYHFYCLYVRNSIRKIAQKFMVENVDIFNIILNIYNKTHEKLFQERERVVHASKPDEIA